MAENDRTIVYFLVVSSDFKNIDIPMFEYSFAVFESVDDINNLIEE